MNHAQIIVDLQAQNELDPHHGEHPVSNDIENLMNEDSSDDQMIKQKSSKSVSHLLKRNQILQNNTFKVKNKIKKQCLQIIMKNKKNTICQKLDLEDALNIFQHASFNIVQTFYNIARNQEYLLFETQESLTQKFDLMKKYVRKSLYQLTRRLVSPKFIQNAQKKLKNNATKSKAKNCKISTSHTVRLEKWLLQNFNYPYPTEQQRQSLAKQCDLNLLQVNNWFINKRQKIIRKYLKKDTKIGRTQNSSADGLDMQESSLESFSSRQMQDQ